MGDTPKENGQVEDMLKTIRTTMMKMELKAFLHDTKKLPFDFKHYMYHRHVNRDEKMQVPKGFRKLEKWFYRTLFRLAKSHQEYLAEGGEYMQGVTLLELIFFRLEKCL